MKYGKNLSIIETNQLANIVCNLKVDRGNRMLHKGHVEDLLKASRQVLLIWFSFHGNSTQYGYVHVWVRLRMDNICVDVHLMKSCCRCCSKVTLASFARLDHGSILETQHTCNIII